MTLGVATLAIGALILGFTAYHPNYDQLESPPKNTESMRSFKLLRCGFPVGELSPTRACFALLPDEQGFAPERLDQLDSITLALSYSPASVTQTESATG